MATSQMSGVIRQIRGNVLLRDGAGLTDGQLLEDYIGRRDVTALADLVCRYGPMVWAVCRRVLHDHHDAEDAFQATFLVLVRKAASIASRELLANWLYGVAHQTALKARATAARRKGRERQVVEMPDPAAAEQDLGRDLQPFLDQELSRLPDKYRVVIVLCDLEGKTRKEAARQLGCPEGTIAGRQARARAMLAKRLARHCPATSTGVLAAVFSQNVASAGVPTAVVSSTIEAANLFAAGRAAAAGAISPNVAALTEGVLKAMLLTKLKIATVVLVAFAVLGMGVASPRQQALAQPPADKPVAAKPKEEKPKEEKPKEETVLSAEAVAAVDAAKSTITLVIKGEGDKTFTVAKDAKVEIDGKPGKLADVPVGGTSVTLKLSDQTTASSIQASGPSAGGEVAAVDAANLTITLSISGEEKPSTVTKDAKVEIDGKPGKLANVPVGYTVVLHLTVDGTAVWSIQATGPRSGGDVKSVDAAKNTLTVTTPSGDQTFEVAKDATIVIDGNPGKLADLKEGMEIGVVLKADKKTVVSITAKDKG